MSRKARRKRRRQNINPGENDELPLQEQEQEPESDEEGTDNKEAGMQEEQPAIQAQLSKHSPDRKSPKIPSLYPSPLYVRPRKEMRNNRRRRESETAVMQKSLEPLEDSGTDTPDVSSEYQPMGLMQFVNAGLAELAAKRHAREIEEQRKAQQDFWATRQGSDFGGPVKEEGVHERRYKVLRPKSRTSMLEMKDFEDDHVYREPYRPITPAWIRDPDMRKAAPYRFNERPINSLSILPNPDDLLPLKYRVLNIFEPVIAYVPSFAAIDFPAPITTPALSFSSALHGFTPSPGSGGLDSSPETDDVAKLDEQRQEQSSSTARFIPAPSPSPLPSPLPEPALVTKSHASILAHREERKKPLSLSLSHAEAKIFTPSPRTELFRISADESAWRDHVQIEHNECACGGAWECAADGVSWFCDTCKLKRRSSEQLMTGAVEIEEEWAGPRRGPRGKPKRSRLYRGMGRGTRSSSTSPSPSACSSSEAGKLVYPSFWPATQKSVKAREAGGTAN